MVFGSFCPQKEQSFPTLYKRIIHLKKPIYPISHKKRIFPSLIKGRKYPWYHLNSHATHRHSTILTQSTCGTTHKPHCKMYTLQNVNCIMDTSHTHFHSAGSDATFVRTSLRHLSARGCLLSESGYDLLLIIIANIKLKNKNYKLQLLAKKL